MKNSETVLIWFFIIALGCAAYTLWRFRIIAIREAKNSKTKRSEAEAICKLLNSSPHPTLAVDNFAKEKNDICTRFLAPGVSYGAENYLGVFLGDNHYEFLMSARKWKVFRVS